MGYRHIMVSDTLAPQGDKLPDWFTDKWKAVSFDAVDYWTSNTELKMYGYWIGFITDVMKIQAEVDKNRSYKGSIQLVFIADERMYGCPDIIHVEVFADKVIQSSANWTSDTWDAEDIANDSKQ